MSVEDALSAVKKAEEKNAEALSQASEKAQDIVETAKKDAAENKKSALAEAEKKRREMIAKAREGSVQQIQGEGSARNAGADPEKEEKAAAAVVEFLRGD